MSEVRVDDAEPRKRSGSFGSNIRRLFSPSKSGTETRTRRGGSLNKPLPSTTQADPSLAGATATSAGTQGLQPGAQLLDTGYQRPPRQSTPVPSFREPFGTPSSAR